MIKKKRNPSIQETDDSIQETSGSIQEIQDGLHLQKIRTLETK